MIMIITVNMIVSISFKDRSPKDISLLDPYKYFVRSSYIQGSHTLFQGGLIKWYLENGI